jgi:hypothetical protein
MDIKVYTPTEIIDTPFPQSETMPFHTSQATGNQTYSPKTVQDQAVPRKIVARETISASLNTKSRKINQEYQFTEQGAIQIGKYVPGVSGDVKLSPSGLVARNTSGETTVGIDTETGDADFAGTIRAGAVIVNSDIVTEISSDGNGRTVYYLNSIPSIVIGDPS